MHDNDIKIQAYFENIESQIIEELKKATDSISICVAWINWNKFSQIFNQLAITNNINIEITYNSDDINNELIQNINHNYYNYA